MMEKEVSNAWGRRETIGQSSKHFYIQFHFRWPPDGGEVSSCALGVVCIPVYADLSFKCLREFEHKEEQSDVIDGQQK